VPSFPELLVIGRDEYSTSGNIIARLPQKSSAERENQPCANEKPVSSRFNV
jgi:hypothetical protein